MKLLSKVPGFRTQNNRNLLIATIYYAFFIGVTIGSSNINKALLYISFILLPFILSGTINIIKAIKNKKFKFDTSLLVNIALIVVVVFSWRINPDITVVKKEKLEEYKSLPQKIEELQEADSNYYIENTDEVAKYLDLQEKYKELLESFEEYKTEKPETLLAEVKQAKVDVTKLYASATELESKVKRSRKN